jgi:hypothetical protein
MKQHRGSILAGIFLILLGLWLLAGRLGANLPDLGQLWPVLVILGGVWSFIDFTATRKPDQLFWAVASVLVGIFFLCITVFNYLEWEDMRRYWPVFVLIFSAASVAEWLAAPSHRNTLYMAGISLLVGLFFLALNLNLLSSTLGEQILQLWPVALILLGLVMMVRAIARNRNA